MDFLHLFRDFIEFHRSTPLLYEKRKQKTLDGYMVRYNAISAFLLDRKLIKLKAVQFTINMANEYFELLSAKHSHNYAVRHVEVCKAVLNYGASKGLIRYNPINSFSVKKTSPDKPVYITPDELLNLEAYLPKTSMIRKAKRLFLFQCYTGLDYSDLTTVSQENIVMHKGRKYIIKKRLKTGITAYIPYTDGAERNFPDKYDLLCNQKYNQALKTIFEDLEIDKKITSHVGRKTFAMIRLNYEGYGIEPLSKMLGHRYVKTTEMYYAQVEFESIVRELDRLGV